MKARWYQNYLQAMGGWPAEEEEPSIEQLSALHKRINVQGHRTIHRLRHLRSLRPEGSKSLEVQDTRLGIERVHNERAPGALNVCAMEGMLQSPPHISDHARCGRALKPPCLRDVGGAAHEVVPLSLASRLLCRRIGPELPFEQDPIKSHDGGESWETTAPNMGSTAPLGLCVRHVVSGHRILADSGPCSGTSLVGSRGKRDTPHTSRTGCGGMFARGHGRYHAGVGVEPQQGFKWTAICCRLTEGEKDTDTKGSSEEKDSSRQGRISAVEVWEAGSKQTEWQPRKTEVLQLEQWKLSVWGFAAWAVMRGKGRKGTPFAPSAIPQATLPGHARTRRTVEAMWNRLKFREVQNASQEHHTEQGGEEGRHQTRSKFQSIRCGHGQQEHFGRHLRVQDIRRIQIQKGLRFCTSFLQVKTARCPRQ